EERPGRLGSLLPLPPAPKLGRVTIVLPPRTSTPGTAGLPLGALPAPPGPEVGAAAGSGFSGAGTFAAHATAGAAAVPDARAIPRAAEAGLIAATGRHRQRTFAAAAGHSYFLPRLRG